MAYSKQTWDTTSFVNPTRMNYIEQGIYDATNKIESSFIPPTSINSKITVSQNYLRRFGRVCEIRLEGSANENISSWESLINATPQGYRPFESNNSYSMTIGQSTIMCNFNENGILNCPNSITQNTNIRFKATYLTRD